MEIGRADDADLACVDKLAECLENIVLRNLLVVLVRVIEIDAIGAEPLERGFGRRRDTRRCELSPPSPASMPTFVASSTASRLPDVFSHSPIMLSDSPPECPSIHAE